VLKETCSAKSQRHIMQELCKQKRQR